MSTSDISIPELISGRLSLFCTAPLFRALSLFGSGRSPAGSPESKCAKQRLANLWSSSVRFWSIWPPSGRGCTCTVYPWCFFGVKRVEHVNSCISFWQCIEGFQEFEGSSMPILAWLRTGDWAASAWKHDTNRWVQWDRAFFEGNCVDLISMSWKAGFMPSKKVSPILDLSTPMKWFLDGFSQCNADLL